MRGVEHEEGATVETNERKRNFRLSRASPEKPLKKIGEKWYKDLGQSMLGMTRIRVVMTELV